MDRLLKKDFISNSFLRMLLKYFASLDTLLMVWSGYINIKGRGEGEIFIKLLIFHLSNLLGIYGAVPRGIHVRFHFLLTVYEHCQALETLRNSMFLHLRVFFHQTFKCDLV